MDSPKSTQAAHYNDTVVRQFSIMAVVWGVVGMLVGVFIVIETDRKGGSMITAELANGYNRDVFAIPGRISDLKSSGCNYLISTNKAQLLHHAEELIQCMGWEDDFVMDPASGKKKVRARVQKELFNRRKRCSLRLTLGRVRLNLYLQI